MMTAHYGKVIAEQVYARPVQRCLERHIRQVDLQAEARRSTMSFIPTSRIAHGMVMFYCHWRAERIVTPPLQTAWKALITNLFIFSSAHVHISSAFVA